MKLEHSEYYKNEFSRDIKIKQEPYCKSEYLFFDSDDEVNSTRRDRRDRNTYVNPPGK